MDTTITGLNAEQERALGHIRAEMAELRLRIARVETHIAYTEMSGENAVPIEKLRGALDPQTAHLQITLPTYIAADLAAEDAYDRDQRLLAQLDGN